MVTGKAAYEVDQKTADVQLKQVRRHCRKQMTRHKGITAEAA